MAIIKKQLNSNYTQIPNEILTDPELSDGAKILMCYLLSKPDNWKIWNKEIMKSLGIGSNSTMAKRWKELLDRGWIERVKNTDNSGQFAGGFDYMIFDTIQNTESGNVEDNQNTGFANVESLQNRKICRHIKTNSFNKTKTNSKTNTGYSIESNEVIFPAKNNKENDILSIFKYWKEKLNHPKAKLDTSRKRIITNALKNYSIDECMKAIDGCSVTPHNMGKNSNNQIYDGLHIILKNAENIERFIRNSEGLNQGRTVEQFVSETRERSKRIAEKMRNMKNPLEITHKLESIK